MYRNIDKTYIEWGVLTVYLSWTSQGLLNKKNSANNEEFLLKQKDTHLFYNVLNC